MADSSDCSNENARARPTPAHQHQCPTCHAHQWCSRCCELPPPQGKPVQCMACFYEAEGPLCRQVKPSAEQGCPELRAAMVEGRNRARSMSAEELVQALDAEAGAGPAPAPHPFAEGDRVEVVDVDHYWHMVSGAVVDGSGSTLVVRDPDDDEEATFRPDQLRRADPEPFRVGDRVEIRGPHIYQGECGWLNYLEEDGWRLFTSKGPTFAPASKLRHAPADDDAEGGER